MLPPLLLTCASAGRFQDLDLAASRSMLLKAIRSMHSTRMSLANTGCSSRRCARENTSSGSG